MLSCGWKIRIEAKNKGREWEPKWSNIDTQTYLENIQRIKKMVVGEMKKC